VLRIWIPNPDPPDPRFFGLQDPDPDPLVRGMDPDPEDLKNTWIRWIRIRDPDPAPSIIMQK
jgi:hypothetical protein